MLGTSCLGVRPPEVAPSGTLGLKTEARGRAPEGPFAVVHETPVGETDEMSEVSIVFSRPVHPLELAGSESAPPARLAAEGSGKAPRGEWHWLGTSALTFAPSEPLARATRFTVTVPAGTRALDGSTLAADATFSFSTPRPRVARTDPAPGSESGLLRPKSTIELDFDQPIALAQVEAHVRFDLEPKPIRVKASYPAADDKKRVQITPVSPLPLDSAVPLVVDESLRGLEGPLPTGEERSFEFRTYGPLRVAAFNCYRETPHKKCAAQEGVAIEFSNPVRFREVARVLSLSPGPQPAFARRGSDEEDWVSYVHVPARLAPAKSYLLSVGGGLKDRYGQTMASAQTFPFDTDDEWPDFEVGLVGSVYDGTKAPPSIPVAAVNVGALDVVAARLDEAAYTRFAFADKVAATFQRVADAPSAKRQSLAMAGAKNARVVRSLDVASVAGGGSGKGLFAFGVRGPGRREANERVATLAVTDLGITAKMSRFGSLVWVTSLETGKPLAGVTVSVRRRNGDEAYATRTDGDGLARIPADRFAPSLENGQDALVFARLGDDLAVRRVRDMLSPWRFTSSSDPEGRLDPIGFVFTDRGVYRPGETLRAKGLFRVPTTRGTATPVGREVHVRGFDPQGEAVFDKTLRLGEFGDFATDVPIPASARLGTFEVRAELAPAPGAKPTTPSEEDEYDRRGVATATAELAAYKASEFKVSVEPDRPAYVRGERATFVTRGDYLFGAPMKGGKARVSIHRGPGHFEPPIATKDGEAPFTVADDAYWEDLPERSPRASVLSNSEGALGAKGELATPVALALPEQHGTETITVESEVEDLTRQTVSAQASAIVHPGDFYVAVQRPAEPFVEEGARVRPNVLAVEPSGKRRSGVTVTLELVRRSWSNVLRGAGESGATTESRVVDETEARCTTTSGAAPASCELVAKSAGYHLVRASARDGRGNAVGASYGFYVLAKGEGGGPTWRETDAATVELVPDKRAYQVGDVATVLVKSPFAEAEALVTVERAGVYTTERRTLKGATPTLRVPITNDMNPNAFVGVHLLRARTKPRPEKGADVGAPAFRLGYAMLAVRPDERRLKVTITPSAKELRPGQEVDVDVAVTDRKGAPVRANATLYAVDEGVLMLTGYKTPDPVPTFSAPRPLAVFTLESREDMARIFRLSPSAPGADKGGEGGGGGSGMRADFRATAWFEPSVLVDRGHAKARFKLPDGLTTYRLMAVVADAGDRFGFGEAQVVTSRRLMLRPALPRFFRAGDFVDAGVIVSTKNLPRTDVDVTLEARGIEVDGETKKRVALDASGQAEVRFRLKAANAGAAELAFRATASELRESDALRLTKTIEVPTSMEAVALAGATESAAAEALGDLRAMRSDVGGLEVSLSSSALVGLDAPVRQVLEYPYGCTEQLTSRLVPLVLASDLLPFVGAAPPPDARRVIDETIGKILKTQKPEGSFGYWPDSARGDDWLTPYVTWALYEAKRRGAAVPPASLELAASFVRRSGRAFADDRNGPKRAQAALAADVLAMIGEPDGGLQTTLFEARGELPLFARALLAHAYALAPKQSAEAARNAARELLRDLDNHVKPTPTGALVVANLGDDYAPLLDSDARTTAMVLRALVALEPRHPLAARLARGLVGARDGGAFRSTQEAAWALVALDEFRRAQEGGPIAFDARVFFGDRLIDEQRFDAARAFSKAVPASSLLASDGAGSALTFQLLGTGRLYYEARLRYARRELPMDVLDRGFYVQKTLRPVRPEALAEALRTAPARSPSAVDAGDLVLVDLHVVTTAPRTQVVLDDALPAGFEALDARLATTSSSAAMVEQASDGTHREVHDDRVLTFFEHLPVGVFHTRYLARATSRGRFLVPPTRAECMYEPEIFGRTAGQVLEVR